MNGGTWTKAQIKAKRDAKKAARPTPAENRAGRRLARKLRTEGKRLIRFAGSARCAQCHGAFGAGEIVRAVPVSDIKSSLVHEDCCGDFVVGLAA